MRDLWRATAAIGLMACVSCRSPDTAANTTVRALPFAQDASAPHEIEPEPTRDVAAVTVAPVVDAGARDVDASDATTSDGARANADRREYELSISSDRSCALAMQRGQLVASCTDASLSCAQATRGPVTRSGEDDIVWLCTDDRTQAIFVVVSSSDAVTWADNVMGDERLCSDHTARVELIAAGTHPTRALLVRARGCSEPGNSKDRDTLWLWKNEVMQRVSMVEYQCTYLETRLAPSTERRAAYSCWGSYLTNPRQNTVTILGYREPIRQRELGADRLMMGRPHVQGRVVWSDYLREASASTE